MGVRIDRCMHAHGQKIQLEREPVDLISGAQELSSQLRQGRQKREAKDDVKGPVCGS